jgi:hypothetical protein
MRALSDPAWHKAATATHSQKELCVQQHILALPQPLLYQILIPGTSKEDKKALRQACK